MISVPSTSVTGGHLELSSFSVFDNLYVLVSKYVRFYLACFSPFTMLSSLGVKWGRILEKRGLVSSERWDIARGRVTYTFI